MLSIINFFLERFLKTFGVSYNNTISIPFQASTLTSGENRQRASVRMSQYLQSWRNIHPFADLSNPDAKSSKKPVIPMNSVVNQSPLSAVCVRAAVTNHLCFLSVSLTACLLIMSILLMVT